MSRLNILYAATLFLSAFLMFSVQPMVAKALLPLLGGSTSVWTLAMVFFQILLLGGYLYAHMLARIQSVKTQGAIHGAVVLAAGLISLPLALHPDTTGLDLDHPTGWQMKTMTLMIAAPFFVLASSAPLLQHWYSRSGAPDARNPYKLYVASNIGSLLALLAYPALAEPFLRLNMQSAVWSAAFLMLAAGLLVSFTSSRLGDTAAQNPSDEGGSDAAPTWQRRAIWIFLAFCPSSLMLGYTTYMATDIASVPLLWVLPLALYLLSFILAFAQRQLIPLKVSRFLQALFMLVFIWLLLSGTYTQSLVILLHTLLFFFIALVCHQELAALRPHSRYLTDFYLCLSVGGALGGICNSLLAPLILVVPYEYPFMIAIAALARYISADQPFITACKKVPEILRNSTVSMRVFRLMLFPGLILLGLFCHFNFESPSSKMAASVLSLLTLILHERRWAFGLTVALIVFTQPITFMRADEDILHMGRNYYGIHKVAQEDGVRKLTHGTTTHGIQAIGWPAYETMPLSYYHEKSGVGDLIFALNRDAGPQNIAVLGLGAGSMACHSRENRFYDFYEIDQDIADIAENPKYFTFLKKCGNYKITIGDARQKIASAPDHHYDMIVVDVFSSDNIPVHVMTTEAVSLYLSKLKLDGILVFHVSNRFFKLEKEVALIGKVFGLSAKIKLNLGGTVPMTDISYFPTKYVAMTRDEGRALLLRGMGWVDYIGTDDTEPWSDDFANLLRTLKLK